MGTANDYAPGEDSLTVLPTFQVAPASLAYKSMSLSPVEWSSSILPNLSPLDKGLHLKIEPTSRDFKLVMETAGWTLFSGGFA